MAKEIVFSSLVLLGMRGDFEIAAIVLAAPLLALFRQFALAVMESARLA